MKEIETARVKIQVKVGNIRIFGKEKVRNGPELVKIILLDIVIELKCKRLGSSIVVRIPNVEGIKHNGGGKIIIPRETLHRIDSVLGITGNVLRERHISIAKTLEELDI